MKSNKIIKGQKGSPFYFNSPPSYTNLQFSVPDYTTPQSINYAFPDNSFPDYAEQYGDQARQVINQTRLKTNLITGSPTSTYSFVLPRSNEKIPFSQRFENSVFGKNFNSFNTGVTAINQLFAGAKNEYSGDKGDITQAIDSSYDAIQGIAGMFGPTGQAVQLGMGAAKLIGNVANKITGGTDAMTGVDALLGSDLANLTGIGLITNIVNSAFGKKADTITRNDEAFETVGSSYTGTNQTVNDALTKSGKKYGLFSSKARNRANEEIAEANRQQEVMTNIADEATDRFAIRNSMAAINGNRRKYYLQGGYNQANIRVGKSGMSLDLIAKAKKVLHESRKLKGGGQITPTEILLVVPEFQDGGQINKKSRTLQELIEYAKKENPRFIQRMSEPPRGIDFVDDEGKQARGSHYMEWSTDDNGNAIIYPRIQEVDKELKFFNSSDAYNRAMENKNYLIMTPEEAKLFFAEDSKYGTAYKSGWPQFFGKFQQGGSINIIPEGALHARKHNMDIEGITKKGIPVVDNNGDQQAEIECEEIIFRLEVTKKLEELEKKFYDDETSQKEKDECALEAGKLLVEEILYNTQDNTNKLL